jgi:hypothetical protein
MWVNDGQDGLYASFWRSLVLFLFGVLVVMLANIAPVFLEDRWAGTWGAFGYLLVYLLGFPIISLCVAALSAAAFYGIAPLRRFAARLPYPLITFQPLHMASCAVFFTVFVRHAW